MEARPVRLPAGRTWKDKILDYEIETIDRGGMLTPRAVEPWKDKILDYEIETNTSNHSQKRVMTWKDKILDYEIETGTTSDLKRQMNITLKR